MAAALGIAIAGPRRYGGEWVEDGWMNEGGRKVLTFDDINRALALYWRACALIGGLVGMIWIIGA